MKDDPMPTPAFSCSPLPYPPSPLPPDALNPHPPASVRPWQRATLRSPAAGSAARGSGAPWGRGGQGEGWSRERWGGREEKAPVPHAVASGPGPLHGPRARRLMSAKGCRRPGAGGERGAGGQGRPHLTLSSWRVRSMRHQVAIRCTITNDLLMCGSPHGLSMCRGSRPKVRPLYVCHKKQRE